MYANWTNQAEQMLRYVYALILLMVVFSKLIVRRSGGDFIERLAARFIIMTVFLILAGYTLVALKLFEMLAILPLIGLVAARGYIWGFMKAKSARKSDNADRVTKMWDWMEGKYNPWLDMKAHLARKVRESLNELMARIREIRVLLESMLLIAVFAISGWIRFYDAFTHGAPAMSDGYVTLAWIKYIDERSLFHDGIYPQGFHIWMDYLVKFAATDPLYILKYTGPLNAILLMGGMYLVVSRWTGNRAAGIIAAAVYGLMGEWISGGSYERQASTNSQEFGFIFIYPALYFLYRWLRDRHRWALMAGIAGMIAAGLVHTLAYVYLGLGVGLLLLIYLPLSMRERFRSIWPVIGGGALSGILSVAPLALGFLIGRELHSSSQDFAQSRNETIYLTQLDRIDYLAAAAIAVILIVCVFKFRKIRLYTGPIFVSLFTLATFLIYYLGNLFTFPGSTVLTSRSGELWAMAIPVAIGVAAGLVLNGLADLSPRRLNVIGLAAAGLTVASFLLINPPKPIIPYKMEWDSQIDQYLKIRDSFRPKTWMIVSPAREGYSLVVGSGIHMDMTQFLDDYDPSKWPLTPYGQSAFNPNIPNDVFLFYQKEVFKVSETNSVYPLLASEYEQRETDKERLDLWIEEQRKVNPNLTIWSEDEHLRVYRLHRPMDQDEMFNQIWGGGASPR